MRYVRTTRYRCHLALLLAAAVLALAGCSKAEPADDGGASASPDDETPGSPETAAAPTAATDHDDAVDGAAVGTATLPAEAEPPVERYTRRVFDLAANLPLAHGTLDGGLVTSLGLPHGAVYVRGGLGRSWSVHHTIDDTPVIAPTGKRAALHVPLTAEQAEAARVLWLRLYNNAPGQEVSVGLQGEAVGSQTIESTGWATVRFDLPAGSAVAGENEVGLRVSQQARLDEIRTGVGLAGLAILPAEIPEPDWPPLLASPTSRRSARSSGRPDSLERGGDERGADPTLPQTGGGGREAAGGGGASLHLPHGHGLGWYVMIPDQGALGLTVGGEPTCLVRVSAHSQQHPEAPITAELAPGAPRQVDLSPLAGTVARLDLVAAGECDRVTVSDAGLVVPGAVPVMPEGVEPPRNVVIWLIDTLRADHLKTYNPSTDVQTPNLDAFASQATVFEHTFSDGNESKVSHASFFSGLYPIRHRHYRSSTTMRDSLELMPEAMRKAGRTTAGFVSNGYISDKWGFEQGWDRFVNTIREGRTTNAGNLYRIAEPWIRKHADEPFYAYFGTIDPHVHYFRHPEFIDLYDPNDAENMKAGKPFVWKASGSQIHAIARGDLKVDDGDKARIRALYKNEISYNDKHFGRMLALLDELGIRDQTMIVVLADHGEEFWEHGGVGHARTLYQHTVHVPLIVSYPPLFPPGTRVTEGADLLDVYATLDSAMQLGVEGLQGQDLARLAQGVDAGYPRPTLSTMGSRRYAMQMADHKLAVEYSGKARLHPILDDPWEQDDHADDPDQQYTLRWMHDAFGLFLAYRSKWDKRTWGAPSNLRPSAPLTPAPDPGGDDDTPDDDDNSGVFDVE